MEACGACQGGGFALPFRGTLRVAVNQVLGEAVAAALGCGDIMSFGAVHDTAEGFERRGRRLLEVVEKVATASGVPRPWRWNLRRHKLAAAGFSAAGRCSVDIFAGGADAVPGVLGGGLGFVPSEAGSTLVTLPGAPQIGFNILEVLASVGLL